ncbi:MAG TPA: hypothetical protein GX515_06835 [Firmicutes bacterium]|nr:hypothetical protein [Bacillota bacterium]
MLSTRRSHELRAWTTLAVASIAAIVLLVATERRYLEYVGWTREVRASLEAASLRHNGEAVVLNAVIALEAPAVGFKSTVERVEFTLDQGGRRLGYFFTLPGDMVVTPPADVGARPVAVTRITVTKDASRELAASAAGAGGGPPQRAGEDGESAVAQLAGDVVLVVTLPRGERLVRVPVGGEVGMESGG